LYRSKSEAESQFLPKVYPRTNLVSARDTRNGPRDLVPIMERAEESKYYQPRSA
jgi:hypothetical protein